MTCIQNLRRTYDPVGYNKSELICLAELIKNSVLAEDYANTSTLAGQFISVLHRQRRLLENVCPES